MSLVRRAALDRRWVEMARVFALDAVNPMFGDMGLTFLDAERLRARARRALEGPLEPVLARQTLLDGCFDETGQPCPEAFEAWADESWITTFQDHPHWWALRRVLVYTAIRSGRHHWVKLPQEQRQDLMTRVLEVNDLTDIEAQVETLKSKPLSDEDVATCADEGLDPDVDRLDFFAFPVGVIRMRRFQALVRSLVNDYSPAALETLRDGAQYVVDHLKIPTELPPIPELAGLA